MTLSANTKKTKTHILRLKPDDNVEEALLSYCKEHKIKSAYIPVFQGGLKSCTLIAMKKSENNNKPDDSETEINEPLEFFGQGIICPNEQGKLTLHIHLSGARKDHTMIGGHLVRGEIVFHAECVLVETNKINIVRKPDKEIYNYPLIHFGD